MAVDIGTLDTFPKLLAHHAQVRGGLPAIREKDLGVWQTWSWGRLDAVPRLSIVALRAAPGFDSPRPAAKVISHVY